MERAGKEGSDGLACLGGSSVSWLVGNRQLHEEQQEQGVWDRSGGQQGPLSVGHAGVPQGWISTFLNKPPWLQLLLGFTGRARAQEVPYDLQKHVPAISKELLIFKQGPENIQFCFFLFSNNSSFSELNNREGEDTKNKNGIVFFKKFFYLLLTKKPLRKHVWVFL